MTSGDRNFTKFRGHYLALTNVTFTRYGIVSPSANSFGSVGSQPRVGTAYAKYVGRVGALAVALGVTGAVVASPGVAWADDTPSSPSSSSEAPGTDQTSPPSDTRPSSTRTTSTRTTSEPTGPQTNPSTTSSTEATGESGGGTVAPSGSETVTSHVGGVIVRSSGGARTSDADAVDADPADGEATNESQEETTPDIEQSGDEPTTGEDIQQSGDQPTTDEDTEQPPAPEQPTTGGTPDASPDTAAVADPVAPTAIDTPENVENTAPAARQSATDFADSPTDVTDTSLQLQSPGDTATALLAATAGPVTEQANPIAAALANLPTPMEVVQQIKATVTRCACNFINQALNLVNGAFAQVMAPSPSAPTAPAEAPILWTVLGWVRRQVEYTVQAFGRTPLGRFVNKVTTQITEEVTDFGNSPLGRQISTQVVQLLEGCQGVTSLPDELERTAIVSGLNEPTDFGFLADENDPEQIHRVLITEKSGAVKVYDPHTGTVSTLVNLPTVTADGERGLVGIEVDPQFWTTGQPGYHTIYVAYTGADNYDRLSSLTLSESLDGIVNETELLKSTELGNNFHHGGEIQFDPVGRYLYWAVGDNTESANAQDLTNIHGKILRLNRDGTAPEDNPFVEDPNAVEQIYAYGFRNPFRFTFAPDGQLLVGDVGEAGWEELNVVTPGSQLRLAGRRRPLQRVRVCQPDLRLPPFRATGQCRFNHVRRRLHRQHVAGNLPKQGLHSRLLGRLDQRADI